MKSALFVFAITGMLAGCGVVQAADEFRPPNVIFILADDLGYGDLGCYGQKQIQTPHLDRMAAEGMRFTRGYAGSTVCAPSRCALMTGLHMGHATIRGNGFVPLRPEDVTVAEMLKASGYSTGLVGKWGLGEAKTSGVPGRQGFDYFYGYLNQVHAHNYYPDFLWRDEDKVPLDNVQKGGVASKKVAYSHDLFTAEALAFLKEHQAQPFFLYLAYTIPHANNEAGRAGPHGMEVPSLEPYADKPWPEPQKAHAAMITRLDRDVGRLFDALRDLKLDEETIVFFSSDNGPHMEGGADPAFFNSSGGLRGTKRALYEGGIRVPFIVRWPGKIKAGQVSDVPVAFWDFLPTTVELAGGEMRAVLDGRSLVPLLLGRKEDEPLADRYLYWEFFEGGFQQAAVRGRWKAVRPKRNGPLELYDLDADAAEKHDVAANHPKIVRDFEDYMAKARTNSKDWPVGDGKAK